MKTFNLKTLIFLTLCCDLGLFAKRLISPAANIITDSLHIPGGIGTGFSLLFLVVAVLLVPRFGCATLMAVVQSAIALSLGMVGSMGALSPVGYIVPGLVMDLLAWATRKVPLPLTERAVLLNVAAAVSAALTANLIVFRLWGVVLVLYVCVAAVSGVVCGVLAAKLARRLTLVIGAELAKDTEKPGQEAVLCEETKFCT